MRFLVGFLVFTVVNLFVAGMLCSALMLSYAFRHYKFLEDHELHHLLIASASGIAFLVSEAVGLMTFLKPSAKRSLLGFGILLILHALVFVIGNEIINAL